jgi:uncharacterized membrane protein YbaN (DUF454 family)
LGKVTAASSRSPITNPVLRTIAAAAGLALTGVGIAGFVVPGLPGTPLLLVAAWLFSISNDRLYRWMVTNRWFGHVVADYRAGLGIPRRIKIVAVSMVVIVLVLSVGLALDRLWLRVLVGGLGLYGIWFIVTRPTREVTVET